MHYSKHQATTPAAHNPLSAADLFLCLACALHVPAVQMQQYRIDAIMREEAAHQASFLVPQEAN
jgi:hypothetical protein